MRRRNVVFSCLFFCIISIVDSKPSEPTLSLENSNDFDVLIFTQEWPQTVCFTWKEDSTSHECSLPRNNEWTIHGIWPSQYHSMHPQYCNSSLPFNVTALKPIEEELKEKWMDIEKGQKPYSFWKHEWDKHGTCAAVLERLNSEVKYFQEGLDLLKIYDMKHVMGKANVFPGSQYTLTEILHGIEKVLGKRGMVICTKNKKTGESYLLELRICFDKALKLIDCDGIYEYPTNCDHEEMITYPDGVPRNFHVLQV